MNIKISTTLIAVFAFVLSSFSQSRIADISADANKKDYAILELRLNMEDEFRTLEGRDNEGLSRIVLFAGKNKGKELLSKGFLGYNQVVEYINEMEDNGWELVDTYTMKGNSLILTHYVFRKKK